MVVQAARSGASNPAGTGCRPILRNSNVPAGSVKSGQHRVEFLVDRQEPFPPPTHMTRAPLPSAAPESKFLSAISYQPSQIPT